MTAAAAAARAADRLTDEVGDHRPWTALAVVVAGGLVEGSALGGLQAWALAPRLSVQDRARWTVSTVVIAGLGWAAASVPSVLAGDDGSAGPPVVLVLAGAAALGAVMGGVLGLGQSSALTGFPHGRRWIGFSAVAWVPTMTVIFAGATTPDASWSTPAVVALGTATGVAAGLVLGLVSGALLPSLDGPPPHNRLVLAVLVHRPHGRTARSLLGLRLRGSRTGAVIRLPVRYASSPRGLVVMPGRADSKRWWRNLAAQPDVQFLHGGRWAPARARVLRPGDLAYDGAREAYATRWPRTRIDRNQVLVVVSPE
ncbi:MAG: hypothetical protein JWL64_2799 [Frankiales bacterium]|nr:hypothetical protein [Frankiales bacterium]